MCVCVCVCDCDKMCVCIRKRERECERECVCMCVCVLREGAFAGMCVFECLHECLPGASLIKHDNHMNELKYVMATK